MRLVRNRLAFCVCVCLIGMAAQPSALSAQYQKFEGLLVRNIQFEPRRQPLEASELHDILPLKMNTALRISEVRASIDRLFATGRYADIQVDAQPYRDGVRHRVHHPQQLVHRRSGRVGRHFQPAQLRSTAKTRRSLDLGQPFTDQKLQAGIENQQRLLESNGLFQGQVRPVFDWETDKDYQQVNIHFEVDSGPRARFATPVFKGDLKMDPEQIARATKFRRWLIHTWKPMTQTRVRQGLEGIRSLYQKSDRLEAKVALESMQLRPRNAIRPSPRCSIDAGPRIEVRPVGAKLSRKTLQRYIPIFEEHAVDHDLLVEGARNLRDYFQSQGYFDAEVEFKEQRVINDKATIDYLINTGARHKLVHIEINGNQYFNTETIRERMYLQPASLLQFRHGRYSEACCAATRDPSAACTNRTAFATSR